MGSFRVIDRRTVATASLEHPSNYPDGLVFVVDKPYGWTSADVVRKVKFAIQRRYHIKNIKVGHAGTLDPLATGVLLICVGKATKSAEALQAERKEYVAEVTFGATTPSFDKEKEVDAVYPYEHITEDALKSVLASMIGEQEQLPPVFSAKYVDGVRAYEKARQGEEVELKTSRITIYETELLSFESPVLLVRIACSKGTYIRSVARDLGRAVGSGAYLTNLRRIVSGGFSAGNALTMDDVIAMLEKTPDNKNS